MVDPYRPPSPASHADERRNTHRTMSGTGLLILNLGLFLIAIVPTTLGLIWVARFLVWHQLFGQPVNRGHHWLVLTVLGSGLILVFGPITVIAFKGIARGASRVPERNDSGSLSKKSAERLNK